MLNAKFYSRFTRVDLDGAGHIVDNAVGLALQASPYAVLRTTAGYRVVLSAKSRKDEYNVQQSNQMQ